MQLVYNTNPANAFAGLKADTAQFSDILSKSCNADIPFGRLVVRATADDICKLPAAATDITARKYFGVALADSSKEPAIPAAAAYEEGQTVSALRRGRVWVKVEQAVVMGENAFVRYAAGGDGLGAFGNTAGTSERAALPGAYYLTGAAIGGLALLDLNL
jgi:hypothetical protein